MFLTVLSCQAQIWTLEKNGVQASASYTWFHYDKAYQDNSTTIDLPLTVFDKTLALDVQYGITDRITALARLPYKMLETTGYPGVYNSYPGQYIVTGKLNNIGNTEFGLVWKCYDDKPIVSASFIVEANTSDRNYITGLQTGFNSWAFRPGIGVGWGFDKSWLQFYTGMSIRTNDYALAVVSNLEAGYHFADYWWGAISLDTRKPNVDGEDCDCSTSATMLYQNAQEYYALALKTGFTMYKDWGLNFGYHLGLTGNDVAATAVPVIGIMYKSRPMRHTIITPRF
ncbi:MAG TPA: hypothetical protein PKC38_06980 [Chitinophagales bacterium]|nr:hypothetical protein [Chitinophagales bacterium]